MNSGSFQTSRKFWSPTQLGGSTRLVLWSERTTSRVIGYHENAVKITSIGRANATAESPPRRPRPARRPSYSPRRSRPLGPPTDPSVTYTGGRGARRLPAEPTGQELLPFPDGLLCDVVRLCEEG